MVSVQEYAKALGTTVQWVRTLCREGKIKANKIGRDWIILEPLPQPEAI